MLRFYNRSEFCQSRRILSFGFNSTLDCPVLHRHIRRRFLSRHTRKCGRYIEQLEPSDASISYVGTALRGLLLGEKLFAKTKRGGVSRTQEPLISRGVRTTRRARKTPPRRPPPSRRPRASSQSTSRTRSSRTAPRGRTRTRQPTSSRGMTWRWSRRRCGRSSLRKCARRWVRALSRSKGLGLS